MITGGAGFIGSHIAEEALARGHEVAVLDNLSSGRMENLQRIKKDLRFVQGDVRDQDLVLELTRGRDWIFHLAALVSVPQSVADPRLSAEINDLGFLSVLEAARKSGVARVVYSSSSAVYGEQEIQPISEQASTFPLSPYAAHKLLGEHYAAMYGRLHGLEVAALRYFNVYGPKQDPSSPYSGVLSIFFDALIHERPVTIHGSGDQTRDFVFVSDVVAANFLAAESESAGGRVVNVGTGRSVSVNELFFRVSAALGISRQPDHGPARTGDIQASQADPSLAREILGFEARVALDQGLERTGAWFR